MCDHLERAIAKLAQRVSILEDRAGLNETVCQEVLGLDVSRWQEEIDWAAVGAAMVSTGREVKKIRMAIIKATQGTDVIDRQHRANAEGAKAAGLLVQYYHYGTPHYTGNLTPVEDAAAEARHYLQRLRSLPSPDEIVYESGRRCSVWLDVEKTADNLSEDEGLSWLLRWLSTVEEAYTAGLYTSEDWLEDEATPTPAAWSMLMTRPDGSRRPLWVARYGRNTGLPDPSYDPQEKVPPCWNRWDVWQYSSKGRVPGIDGDVDLDLATIVR